MQSFWVKWTDLQDSESNFPDTEQSYKTKMQRNSLATSAEIFRQAWTNQNQNQNYPQKFVYKLFYPDIFSKFGCQENPWHTEC